tara:strand:- start:4305 stop:5342 length:1038 start_codon:yes stop_codon:yes gene_type:complete
MEAQQIDSTEQEVQTADEPNTPTLKETLQAAMQGEDSLPEVPAEPMQEVQAEEPEQTEEVAEQEQVEEQAPALEALSAPKHWPKEEQEKFNVLDADTQHLVMDRFKAMEGDYTRKTQAIAKYKKRNEALDEIYGPFRDDFQRAGMDDVAATRQLLAAHKYLREDPQQAIKWLAKSYGVDLTAVNDDTATDEYADPQMKAMQQQIAQLQGTINNQQQQAQNMQKQEVQAMIDNFQTAKDADGNLKHPHFETVQNQMSGLISSGVAKDIASAYDMAVFANPETRAKVLDEQVKKTTKQEVKAEAVQKAKKQQRVNVKGSGTPSNSAIPSGMTLNETIKFSMKQLQKG